MDGISSSVWKRFPRGWRVEYVFFLAVTERGSFVVSASVTKIGGFYATGEL